MKRLAPITLLAPAALLANAIFTVPPGCAALAPAPDVTGVQCFGSFSDASTALASFTGSGSGPLFATSATFDWVYASINGRSNLQTAIGFSSPHRFTGSLSVPLLYGETLTTWSFQVDATGVGATALDILSTGVGLRLLMNHTPPSAAVPKPATVTACALGLLALLLLRRQQASVGIALVAAALAPAAKALPIFDAPPGCTAIQPSPAQSGVQCYGSNDLNLEFSGAGSGPLRASEVVFEFDFSVSRAWGSNAPVLVALVNGEFFFRLFDVIHEPQVRHTGRASIPYTPGTPLTSWSVSVTETWGGTAGGVVLSARPTVSTPLDGVGFRFLANDEPPASAPVPEPGTDGALALGAGLLALSRTGQRRYLPLLVLLMARVLPANAIFTVPPGCTALAPAPDVTGVQCSGSFTQPDPDQPLIATFSGGGSGPLWATSATLDYDFLSSSAITRAITISASLNGGTASTAFLAPFGSQRHTGSLTIPLTYGETLDSWLLSVFAGTDTPDGSRTLDIPPGGLQLLVSHTPPVTAVPEPGPAGLLVLAGLTLTLLSRAKRMPLLSLLALAPLSAAPIFTAPAGCTAIQPAPQTEGVQCFGDTGLIAAAPELSFTGGGTGPLWASEIVLEWDFVVSPLGGNITQVIALVNGESGFFFYPLDFGFNTRYTGSLTIPYTPGAVLSSWSMQAITVPNTLILGAVRRLDTPLDGAGLRLLAVNTPPSASAAVPEPSTLLLAASASVLLRLLRRGQRRQRLLRHSEVGL